LREELLKDLKEKNDTLGLDICFEEKEKIGKG